MNTVYIKQVKPDADYSGAWQVSVWDGEKFEVLGCIFKFIVYHLATSIVYILHGSITERYAHLSVLEDKHFDTLDDAVAHIVKWEQALEDVLPLPAARYNLQQWRKKWSPDALEQNEKGQSYKDLGPAYPCSNTYRHQLVIPPFVLPPEKLFWCTHTKQWLCIECLLSERTKQSGRQGIDIKWAVDILSMEKSEVAAKNTLKDFLDSL